MPRSPQGSEAYRRAVEGEDTNYITLVCQDGFEAVVPDYIAFHSGYVDYIIVPSFLFFFALLSPL
jgi:hypothetical protein